MVTRIGIGMKWENGREQAEQQDLDNQDARWHCRNPRILDVLSLS